MEDQSSQNNSSDPDETPDQDRNGNGAPGSIKREKTAAEIRKVGVKSCQYLSRYSVYTFSCSLLQGDPPYVVQLESLPQVSNHLCSFL